MTAEKLTDDSAWRALLDQSSNTITRILDDAHRVAVLGIKTETSGGPAFSVPAHLQRAGYDIVPVPVYFPEVTEILGEPVDRTLGSVVPPADLILVFRRPTDIPQHLAELLAAKPRVVWMQLGIRNDDVAEVLARAGIAVVQDACMMVEHRRRVAS